ncbi:hypothetical protein LTR56_012302 [Elasticomyces elasticus]|nr:hypothetical protein LTR56_012302 [Elasticomyces elasticus]KAK3641258.1 hypothetical protein LTR22_016626 [Elasticomyces elasticus]KAK4922587.1 hypothetical protein LTR49_010114 [Elasticomyces elasticus]KAK5760760.1 hypothetical protein LTS12_009118 [Elasticomyces elasticus]
MPTWKGWPESDVRQPGFTPINAPASTASAKTTNAANKTVPSDANGNASKSVASGYLGRDSTDQAPQIASVALHGPGAKKGRKRAASTATTAAAKSKRRKSGDVSDGMSVKKAAQDESSNTIPTKKPVDAKRPITDSNHTSSANTRKRIHQQYEEESADAAASAPVRPVPVYAQSTSMDSVQSHPPATSMATLKASTKRSTTIYKSGQEGPMQQGGTFARPLLSAIETRATRASNVATPGTETVLGAVPVNHASREQQQRPVFDDVIEEIDLSTERQVPPKHTSTTKAKSKKQSLLTLVTQTPSIRKRPSRKSKRVASPPIQTEDELFALNISDDEAMADAADSTEDAVPLRTPTPPARDRKQNMREVDADDDYGGALLTDNEKIILNKLQADAQLTEKRIVRTPFPESVLDRSPIFGATNATVLRVCFRIGEALNAGSLAVRNNKNALLELYARVTESYREEKPGRHQHFVFHDLYHDKPPYLTGTCDLWDQSGLWELDSRAFLSSSAAGTVCRAIARMKRDGMKWKLEVLSIWEASWEDVEHVAGIYSKGSDENMDD